MSPDALAATELQREADRGEALSTLPQGWAWASLGETLPLEYGKALPERLRNPSGR
jgi:type I restriction enzyme S subunit